MARFRVESKGCFIYNWNTRKWESFPCDKVPMRVQRAIGAPLFRVSATKSIATGTEGKEPPVTVTDLPGGGKQAETPDLPGETTGREGFNIFGINVTGTHIAIAVALLLLLIAAIVYFA